MAQEQTLWLYILVYFLPNRILIFCLLPVLLFLAPPLVLNCSSGMGVSALFLKSFRFSLKFWDGLFLSLGSTLFFLFLLSTTFLSLWRLFGCGSDGVIRRFCFTSCLINSEKEMDITVVNNNIHGSEKYRRQVVTVGFFLKA